MSAEFKPVLVVLAAGLSRRFEGIKLLSRVQYQQKEYSMLQLAINKLEPLELPLVVATGQYHQELVANKSSGAVYHYCSQAKLGLGHTINQITQFVEVEFDACSHIFITLADQVALAADDLEKLLLEAQEQPQQIICCETPHGVSAPAIFPRRFFHQLKLLVGDKGAKKVIIDNLGQSIALPMPKAAIDIDFKKDLLSWNNNNSEIESGELA